MSFPQTIQRLTASPAELELAYQQAVKAGSEREFAEALEASYAQAADNLLLAAWHYRLAYAAARVKSRVVAWGWALPLGLVPTEVYKSNWSIPIAETDIVSLVIIRIDESQWEITFDSIHINSVAPKAVDLSYSFPWTGGQTWLKTQGFHYNNLGYSLDFIPSSGAGNNVLAIESGTFSAVCYVSSDPYQAMVKVTHGNGDVSGYLHLDKGSVPSGLFSQAIAKGQHLGSLYTGSAIYLPHPACTDIANYQFATACGCGYGTHLHFEANNNLITIQGYSLQSISDSATNTPYISNNSGTSCCGCGTLAASKETGFWSGVWTTLSEQPAASIAVSESPAELPVSLQPVIAATPPDVLRGLRLSPIWGLPVAPAASMAAPVAPPPVEEPALIVTRAPVEPQREPPASASYAIPKSVFGSGGGPKTATSYKLQGTNGQPSGVSALASSSYRLRSGYWSELACPLAELAAAPRISVSASSVTLAWDAVAGASAYRIYRGAEPYFPLGVPYGSTTSTVWTDSAGAGDPLINYTYVVRAVNACGESSALYRLGEFDFALTPGN